VNLKLCGKPGLFHKLVAEGGLSNGFAGVEFDPDYARNGKFYTVPVEDPKLEASPVPVVRKNSIQYHVASFSRPDS
jgi:hypothetical protein